MFVLKFFSTLLLAIAVLQVALALPLSKEVTQLEDRTKGLTEADVVLVRSASGSTGAQAVDKSFDSSNAVDKRTADRTGSVGTASALRPTSAAASNDAEVLESRWYWNDYTTPCDEGGRCIDVNSASGTPMYAGDKGGGDKGATPRRYMNYDGLKRKMQCLRYTRKHVKCPL